MHITSHHITSHSVALTRGQTPNRRRSSPPTSSSSRLPGSCTPAHELVCRRACEGHADSRGREQSRQQAGLRCSGRCDAGAVSPVCRTMFLHSLLLNVAAWHKRHQKAPGAASLRRQPHIQAGGGEAAGGRRVTVPSCGGGGGGVRVAMDVVQRGPWASPGPPATPATCSLPPVSARRSCHLPVLRCKYPLG